MRWCYVAVAAQLVLGVLLLDSGMHPHLAVVGFVVLLVMLAVQVDIERDVRRNYRRRSDLSGVAR